MSNKASLEVKCVLVGTTKALGEWLLSSDIGFTVVQLTAKSFLPEHRSRGYRREPKWRILPETSKPWHRVPSLNTPMRAEAKIELHEAKRAGTHLDLRIKINGKIYDFAIVKKTQLPKSTKEGPYRIVRRDTHSLRYFNMERTTFEPGTYGEGEMRTIWRGPIDILYADNEKIEFEILDGEFKGRYCLFTEESPHIPETIIRMKDEPAEHIVRRDFTGSPNKLEEVVLNQDDYIAEFKYDGSCTTMKAGVKYNTLVSRRLSVTGQPIDRSLNVSPSLRYWKIPKEFQGRTIHMELDAQTGGVTKTSSLLNSYPSKSRTDQIQNQNYIIGYVWDIEPPKDFPEMAYEERRAEYTRLANSSPRIDNRAFGDDLDFFFFKRIKNPRVLQPACGSDVHNESPSQYSREIKLKGWEGTVWKKKSDKYYEGVWVKDKKDEFVDMLIGGYVEGEGKYNGSLGAIVAWNPETEAWTNVGTGFTDQERQEIWDNKEDYLGRKIEVKVLEVNSKTGVSRAPRFQRIHSD